jgi:hypothetical protein
MTPTEIRLQLLANGYTPLPNIGKTTYLKGWPSIEVTPELIEGWRRKRSRWADTGIRVENGLCVIDFDINHEAADDIADALEDRFPALAQALLRFGKGTKRAWFLRCDEPFTRIHTRRWLGPGADLDRDGTQVVEVFGGSSPRQFGAFGAHTRGPDGEIEISYSWAVDSWDHGSAAGTIGNSPLLVPLADLPEITKATVYEIVDFCEAELVEHGFAPVVRTTKGESEATRVYDLTDEMVFETNTGERDVPLQELRNRRGEAGLRVSASFIEPGREHSLTRCLVGTSHSGEITIWDSATGVTHMPQGSREAEGERTHAERAELLKRIAEKAEQIKTQRQTKPSAEDSAAQVASKLLRSYAWCPTRQLQIVPFWSTSTEAGMTLTNFRTTMLPYAEDDVGPRGGIKKINPADLWVASPQRVQVEGLQLRPDMPRPIFEEHGKRWVNTYDPEIHSVGSARGGSPQGGLDLLEQLLPDLDERRWFSQWLAHKYRFPDVPGPAVVMVARQHGTGRGTLGELVKALFGARYVGAVGFDHFAGRTYQSQYTEWQADSLVVIVNESSTADAGSVYRAKHDTYERLKEIVDPRASERQIIAKGLRAFRARVCASYLIFTNNPDALPLPAGDRRFWVGTNGEPREPEFWQDIDDWLRVPANIAAFAQWLADLDLDGFDPYAVPPMTKGKRAMTALSLSDIDRGLELALEALPGALIVPEQVIGLMRSVRDEWSFEYPDRWEGIARRALQRQLVRVGEVKDGPDWVVKIEGKKYPVYARTERDAGRWRSGSMGGDLRQEVLRNGVPGGDIKNTLQRLQTIVDNTKKGDGS